MKNKLNKYTINTDDCFCTVFLHATAQSIVARPIGIVDARPRFVEAHFILCIGLSETLPDNGPLGPVYFGKQFV